MSKDKKAPLIVALHGLGGNQNTMMTRNAIQLAEEGGYILVAPMGYNSSGWFGAPSTMATGGIGAPTPAIVVAERAVAHRVAVARLGHPELERQVAREQERQAQLPAAARDPELARGQEQAGRTARRINNVGHAIGNQPEQRKGRDERSRNYPQGIQCR